MKLTDEERKNKLIKYMIKSFDLNPTDEELAFLNNLTLEQLNLLNNLINKAWEDGTYSTPY